ncbi:TraR/DksA family transcriptional regulator [Erwinia phage Gungnir39]|nr:TraR/DksA family transcriptional regulator [Erwinia phage Gungnir39]
MAEIIDEASELEEMTRALAIRNITAKDNRPSREKCIECDDVIPEKRRQLISGCQRCSCCQEINELRSKSRVSSYA